MTTTAPNGFESDTTEVTFRFTSEDTAYDFRYGMGQGLAVFPEGRDEDCEVIYRLASQRPNDDDNEDWEVLVDNLDGALTTAEENEWAETSSCVSYTYTRNGETRTVNFPRPE